MRRINQLIKLNKNTQAMSGSSMRTFTVSSITYLLQLLDCTDLFLDMHHSVEGPPLLPYAMSTHSAIISNINELQKV
jgi:hypothetical protein